MVSQSLLTTNQLNKEVTMPELTEIQGKLNIDGLICSLALEQAIQEIEKYEEEGDEVALAVLQNMFFALVDALEPIEE